jgi:tetratricopeptide (TPR) repeat protein
MSSRGQIKLLLVVLLVALIASKTAWAEHAVKPSADSALTQAERSLAKHDLAGAESSVWTILNSDPNNARALVLLGVIRDQQQRYSEAEAVLEKAQQLAPKSAEARIYLGKTYLAQNKLPQATQQFEAAESLDPRNPGLRIDLARLYAANGEFASALSTLNGIPSARFPAEGVPIKVGSLLALGRSEEAFRTAESAKSPALQLAVAEIFVTSKMPQQALKFLAAAEASGKRPPARFYFVKGKALDEDGKSALALENLQKALALEPNSEEFMLATAELYARQNKHDKAYELLQRAHKSDPDSVAVLRPLVLEGVFANKTTEVQDAADELAKKSSDPRDLFVVADVLIKNTRQDEAIPLLQKYLEKFPDDPRAWVGLGLGYEDKKQFQDAENAFERALQADPKFAEAEYQIGVLKSVSGDSAAAIPHYERAIEFDPNHLQALTKLGGLYLQSGDFNKALTVLLKAEAIDPNDRKTEYSLALAYSKLGNREEAKVHMERFQSKGPIGATEKK